jgi:hypothetical protein
MKPLNVNVDMEWYKLQAQRKLLNARRNEGMKQQIRKFTKA